jgi:FAD synthetase
MVFGCFDLLHEGHKNFMEQASRYGKVIAIVSRDSIIRLLKKRDAVENEQTRLQKVKNCTHIWQAFLGDEILGEFSMIRLYAPDFIAVGYDQNGFYSYILTCMQEGKLPTIPVLIMEPYLPELYHTSIIRKQLGL